MFEILDELTPFEVQKIVLQYTINPPFAGNIVSKLEQKIQVNGDKTGPQVPVETKLVFQCFIPSNNPFWKFREEWNFNWESIQLSLLQKIHNKLSLQPGERYIQNEWDKVQKSHIRVKGGKRQGKVIVTLYCTPQFVEKDDLRRYMRLVKNEIHSLIYNYNS